MNLSRVLQLYIVTAIIIVWYILNSTLRDKRGSYNKLLWFHCAEILSDYDIFRRYTRFTPTTFVNYLWLPLQDDLKLPRNFMLSNTRRKQKCQISDINRLIRYCMYMAGWTTASLSLIFRQSCETVICDIDFIAELIVSKLYNKYIYLPPVNSLKYNSLIGSGVLDPYFPNAIYVIDVVKIRIQKPRYNQRNYYDGHHKQHDCGFLVMCTGSGEPVFISDQFEGRKPDGVIWHESSISSNTHQYIQPNNYILADRIFRYEPPPLLTSYTGYNHYTQHQLLFNYHHAQCRVIVENLFGRLKKLYPCFLLWKRSRTKLKLHFYASMTTLCIILQNQDPLRN